LTGKWGLLQTTLRRSADTDLRRPQRQMRAAQALSSHPRRGLATPAPSPPSARRRVPPMPSELSTSSSQCTAGHATEGRRKQALHSPLTSVRSRRPRAATTTFIAHGVGALAVVRRHQKAGAARVIRRVLQRGCIPGPRAFTPPPPAVTSTLEIEDVSSSTCALVARAVMRARRRPPLDGGGRGRRQQCRQPRGAGAADSTGWPAARRVCEVRRCAGWVLRVLASSATCPPAARRACRSPTFRRRRLTHATLSATDGVAPQAASSSPVSSVPALCCRILPQRRARVQESTAVASVLR